MKFVNTSLACGVLIALIATEALAQRRPPPHGGNGSRPPMREHTATSIGMLNLVPAIQSSHSGYVSISESNGKRFIKSNGVPDHNVGSFPNRGNPNRISSQSYNFAVTLTPRKTNRATSNQGSFFGVALNGVPFEPGTGEFWQGNRNSGWNYDALGAAVPLGLDANHAHVQPNGAYHYHFKPTLLAQELNWSRHNHSPLIGWAADGFPIYMLTGNVGDGVRELRSSYQLKSGNRPGGNSPSGRYDGTFVQDYRYVAGSGDLDECNGGFTVSADYPKGTYAYFITNQFPYVSRCWKGTPDASFMKRRRR